MNQQLTKFGLLCGLLISSMGFAAEETGIAGLINNSLPAAEEVEVTTTDVQPAAAPSTSTQANAPMNSETMPQQTPSKAGQWDDNASRDDLQRALDEQQAENEALQKKVRDLEEQVDAKGLSTEEIARQIEALKAQMQALENSTSAP